jgi:hypothetical protein
VQSLLFDEFGEYRTESSIGRALRRAGWSKKICAHTTSQRDKVARAMYLQDMLRFTPEQLVYVDKTYVSDKVSIRRRGWSPRGRTPRSRHHLHYAKRYSVLPAYSIDGWLLEPLIVEGSVNADRFNA